MYTTWQNFSQALLVDSLLLSYIDVWHKKFLPPAPTTGEAQDLSPHYTTANDIVPVRDESTKCVSQNCKRHEAIGRSETAAPVAEKETTEPVGTLGTKSSGVEKMVK